VSAPTREQLLQALTAKLAEYRHASRGTGGGSRANPASAIDLYRLNMDGLMRLHGEIAELTEAIRRLPPVDSPARAGRRAELAKQLQDAESRLRALEQGRDDARRSAAALEARHLALLLELT